MSDEEEEVVDPKGSVDAKCIATKECAKLLRQKRRPLVFADTAPEAAHLLKVLQAHGIAAQPEAMGFREGADTCELMGDCYVWKSDWDLFRRTTW